MAARNSIQVCIKVRPLLMPKERHAVCLWQVKENSIHLVDSQADPFFFDFIFDKEVNNQEIFEKMAKNIVHACVKGFNGTIFAYGQTSSGKTYTMMGDEENPGVMVLAAKEIFKQIEENADRQFLIRVGYIEIYNEKIYDLLDKKNQDLKIHESTTGIVNINCEEKIIRSEEELLYCLCMGSKERTVGGTNMNERSSRSHAIFRIIIESRKTDRSEGDAVIQSILNLVDLAGSERANQTGAVGARLKEGGHINKSLLFLSNVIKSLSENEDHKYISYRDSKLTRILQASLGGNALTSIICTIKPTTIEETLSTLNFAMRAKIIKNKPQLNEIVSEATMMKRLEREIKELKDRLDEEKRKNESQIKVGQLEQRIKDDMLKIISCNSLHNVRNIRENRRRTWCPASSLDEHTEVSETRAQQLRPPSTNAASRSQLPKPNFYASKVTTRDYAPKTVSIFKSLDVSTHQEEDDFKPAEQFNFSGLSGFQTPRTKITVPKDNLVYLTPTLKEIPGKTLEIVEHELTELQKFTSLENQFEVQHELYEALKQKLNIVSDERDRLEKERLVYIQNKEEFEETKQNLHDSEKRCDDFQIQISKLTNSNQLANEKISKYEEQLADLKQTIAKLEMENREAVSLEFEFQRHKSKTQLRETELLSVLSEKDSKISLLQKKLDAATEDALRNTKDEQLKDESVKNQCETGNICVKCEDLQRLLEENKKVSTEFEKLTLEYEKLQQSYQQMSSDAAKAQIRLDELEQSKCAEAAECEKLRAEIASIRAKLLEVQTAYEQISCDRNEKTETCEELNRIVATAHNDMQVLQTKYDKLELAWQEQEQAIKDIQAEYDAIQSKYQSLQAQYEQLEQNSVSSLADCERLQSENKNLQAEIGSLKTRVEEAQRMLLEAPKEKLPDLSAELNELRQKNMQLNSELDDIQKQFDSLQQEYDDLSNQLMENIQESDVLREKCAKLEEEKALKTASQTPTPTSSLKTCVCDSQFSDVDSMKSSGVCTDTSETSEIDIEILNKFLRFTETLHEIELKHENGSARVFRAKEISSNTLPAHKLCIRNIQEIIAQESDDCVHYEGKMCLQGVLKNNSFHIIEMTESQMSDLAKEEAYAELKQYIAELEKEIDDKNMLLEVTEGTIKEMRDQMTNLESALLEKSVIVEKVEDYQRQIFSLEREKAEITIVCEELQEKVKEITVGESFLRSESNETLSCSQMESTELDAIKAQRLELETKLNTLQVEFEREVETLREKNELIQQLQEAISAMTADKVDIEKRTSDLQQQLQVQATQTREDAELIGTLQASKVELNERCVNAESVRKELEENIKKLETQLEEKSVELKANVQLIAQLKSEIKEVNAMHDATLKAEVDKLKAICDNAEAATAKLKAGYEQQLSVIREELETTKSLLKTNEKQYKDEVNRINLELYEKLELSECEFRKNLQKYNREWEESKDLYETKLAELESKLIATVEQKEKKDAENQFEIERLMKDHSLALAQFHQEKHELESTNESNKELITKLQNELVQTEKSTSENVNLMATAEQLKVRCVELEKIKAEMETELKKNVEYARQENCKYEQQLTFNSTMKSDYEDRLKLLENENSDLKISIQQCQLEIQNIQQELKVKCEALEKANAEQETELKKNVECAKQEVNKYQEQLTNYATLKSDYEDRLKLLENEKSKLKNALEQSKLEMQSVQQELALKNMLEATNAQLTAYVEELKLKCAEQSTTLSAYDLLKVEYNNSVLAAKEQRQKLEHEVNVLKIETAKAEENTKTLQLKVDSLAQELLNAKQKSSNYDKLMSEQAQRGSTLAEMNEKLTEEQQALKRHNNELKSALNEMKLKLDTLQADFKTLEAKNTHLEVQFNEAAKKTQECESMREALERLKSDHTASEELRSELKQLKAEYNVLEKRLVTTVVEADKTSKTLREELGATKSLLEEDAVKHKKTLETYQAKKKQLEGTVSCLLAEKKSMEERLNVTEVTIKRLETELSSLQRKPDCTMNISHDSNNSMSSPKGRRSLDRAIGDYNVNVVDKLTSKDHKNVVPEERRNRRVSLYDERRRLSQCNERPDSNSKETREVGSMTEYNCECTELSNKLKDCERTLYIREGQVKSLRMDIRNHPAKDENVALKKRLQEEQEKHRSEIKRLKQKNQELLSVINEPPAAVISPITTTTADSPTTTETPPKVLSNAETQTESDLETICSKLQSKLTDAENICRFRYKLIRDLEQKVQQSENSTEHNGLSSLEAGQMSALKTQNDTLKSELAATKEKFENAVRVLRIKRKEVEQLKEQLSSTNCELPR